MCPESEAKESVYEISTL